ncbi:hypothetical protein E0198_003613 [Clavispora lusitaniae]|nr:hypothetical protein E0198_003613 [Clavispora lusitaniae]
MFAYTTVGDEMDNFPMYQFTEKGEIEPLYERIEYLSLISESPDIKTVVENISGQYFVYRRNDFQQIWKLVKYITDSDSKHYSIEAASGTDILSCRSQDGHISLNISQSTILQNNYVTRYLKFTKTIPAKSSLHHETRYHCRVNVDEKAKWNKDLVTFISQTFSKCKVEILSDIELPFELERIRPTFIQKQIASHSNLSPLNYAEINNELSVDMYEYLCLLHVDGLPNRSDEHVKLTNMYEIPQVPLLRENPGFSTLYLTVAADVNPSIVSALSANTHVLSFFARTRTHNFMVLQSRNSYLWKVTQDNKEIC